MHPVSADDILDAALRLVADRHWETLRLTDVAAELDIALTDIHAHYPDKEALVDALWGRADAALLRAAAEPELAARTVPEQLETLVFAWLVPLEPHRRTAREMLLTRLEPGHLHIQIPSLIRVSRTVQWLREGAGLRAAFVMRALEETALTALFLVTVAAWLRDGGEARARDILRRGLAAAHEFRGRLALRHREQ